MPRAEPGSTRLIATLAAAGAISGLVLAGVHLATEPRILDNQRRALDRAILEVLPGTTQVTTLVVRDGGLEPWQTPDGGLPTEPAVYAGHAEDGRLVGYAIPADGPGFMDTIRLIYGYDPQRRRIVGLQVLDNRETPGLGDRIVTDAEFQENFRALAIDPGIVPVKRGRKTRPNEVDCITGATISSEAVAGILARSTAEWAPNLDHGDAGKEP